MAKTGGLAAALAKNKQSDAPPSEVDAASDTAPLTKKPAKRGRAKAREGQVCIAGYYPETVRYTIEELRLKRARETHRRVTTQDLLAEAMNELFKKYGFPEVAPVAEE